MENIKENLFVKQMINIEKKIYFNLLNHKLEMESEKRRNGWKDIRYQALLKLKDKYAGERCFIIGMGPSLTKEDLNMIKKEFTFGMNSIALQFDKDTWRPTFYGIQDIYVYPKVEQALLNENKKKKSNTIYLVGSSICKKFNVPKNWVQYPLNAAYHKYEARIHKYFAKADDNCYAVVYDGYSVTYSLAELAMYMGFKEIYLIGTDCNYEKNKKQHFLEYGYQDKNYMTVGESMIVAFKSLKKLADQRGIKIFNVTRGGMLEVFQRIKLEDIYK